MKAPTSQAASNSRPEKTDFAIYIHWPFCTAKCPYCDFNSHVRHRPVDQKRFLKAYQQEIAYTAKRTPERQVKSIFFGGGTPSLMAPEIVQGILETIYKHWQILPEVEITLEANPQSVDAERFIAYRKAGINRLSLGIQALNNKDLRCLGRLHTVEEALQAIYLAKRNFPRLSFDLIYARPHQKPKQWVEELSRAIELAADHLSLYQLTIEPETRFFDLHKAGKLSIPCADDAAEYYALTQNICNQAGMPAYEISNHAAPGCESQHNLIYWRYGEYAGIGPGAHGRLIDANNKLRFATTTERNPERWLSQVEIRGHGMINDDELSPQEQADEFLIMGLRLSEGIDLNSYEALSGRTIAPHRIEELICDRMIEQLPSYGLKNSNKQCLRATAQGAMVLDAIVTSLTTA